MSCIFFSKYVENRRKNIVQILIQFFRKYLPVVRQRNIYSSLIVIDLIPGNIPFLFQCFQQIGDPAR